MTARSGGRAGWPSAAGERIYPDRIFDWDGVHLRDVLVVASARDVAAVNIRDRMLERGSFIQGGQFDGMPMHAGHGMHLVTIADDALFRNNVDSEFYQRTGVRPEGVIYLSRHSAKSGTPSLTVHPIGNFSHALYGGYFRQIVHAFPGAMTQALRSMDALARERGLPHKVSFEVTHHGPYLNTPTFFIEIGSDESAWPDREAAEVIARALLGLDVEGVGQVVLGVGGGHYAPRHTELALRKAVSYSHIIPGYAINSVGERMMEEMLDYTCEARLVYFHRKTMRSEELARLTAFFESMGMRAVRERELPDLPGEPTPPCRPQVKGGEEGGRTGGGPGA